MTQTYWSINIIGDQSLEITNGEKFIYKEYDWLSGQGAYAKLRGYKIPNLIDLWEEIKGSDPQFVELHYADFIISKYDSGFVFRLESGYKDIVSDLTAEKQDLLSFIEILNQIIVNENKEKGFKEENKDLKTVLSKLEEIPTENEVTYEH